MNQSSFILGALLAGFVLFLAARGRLNAYASVLWGAAPSGPRYGSVEGGGTSTGSVWGDVLGDITSGNVPPIGDIFGGIGEGMGDIMGNYQ